MFVIDEPRVYTNYKGKKVNTIRTSDCQICYNKKLDGHIPKIYMIRYGYVCLDCLRQIKLDVDEVIEKYNKLTSSNKEYCTRIVAGNL